MTCSILPKYSSSMHLENITHHPLFQRASLYSRNRPSSVLNMVKKDEASSSCWCQNPFLQSLTVVTHAPVSKHAISSGVLKWYGSCTIALFRLAGSKQILSLSLQSLSLLSTSTKLFIQGVAWCRDFRIPACNILSISCFNGSFRCTCTGQQEVCLGVMLGSTCMW